MAEKKQRKNVECRINKFEIAPPTPGIEPTGKPLDSTAAARRLNICKNTLFSRCYEGLLVHYVNGNAFEFYEPHLDDYKQRSRRNG